MRRTLLFFTLLLCGVAAAAQDVLTIGTGSTPSGGVASVPVSIRDNNGTPLGTDAGAGNRIQGIAFKVFFPTESVASVTFARGGVLAGLTPLFESSPSGDGFRSYVVAFAENSNVIPFTPNADSLIGTLTVTLKPQAVAGSTIPLTIDAPSAGLSNQAGTASETVSLGNLSLVNGSVSVTIGLPSNLVATASSTSNVNVTWNAVSGADHYELQRSVDGAAFAFLINVGSASHSDSAVVAGKTYLYRVRAVDGIGGLSGFSNTDAATTIVFTDDPLVAGTTLIKAIHFTQLRTAVNAFRASAGLGPLASDPSVAAGLPILTHHVTDLRTGLDAARTVIGLPVLSYTDAPPVLVKAVHVVELRNGVK